VERHLIYHISSEHEGTTIERFLKSNGFTRQSLVRLKKTYKNVVIDNEWVHLTHRLGAGEVMDVTISEDDSSEKVVPVDLPFPVVYEDEDILVVNKPAGMPIHPSLNNYENTLGNAAAFYFEQRGEKIVFRCVNRLDRDTTGLTIIAKHYLSAGILHEMMRERRIHREYIAVVQGEDMDDCGRVTLPIGRVADSTIERRVDFENGETAVTCYKVLERRNGLSMVSLYLETGRTHQIRVHMKAIGHPLIGDWLYNPEDKHMLRQALHSRRLEFVHPITGEDMIFTADIPEDMRRAFGYETRI